MEIYQKPKISYDAQKKCRRLSEYGAERDADERRADTRDAD